MKIKLFYIYIFLFAALLAPEISRAQCCTAGNPAGTNCSLTNCGKNILDVSFTQNYAYSDMYYIGNKAETNKLYGNATIKNSYLDFSSLALSYGLTSRIRINADLGYYIDKYQVFNVGYTRYAQGLADGTIGIIYKAYSTDDNTFQLSPSAKLSIPVGPFHQVYDGIELPIDFQPSAGNYRYNLGLMMSKNFEGTNLSLFSINSVEISQPVEAKNTLYKYGNLYNLSVMGMYGFSNVITGLLQFRFEFRNKARETVRSNDSTFYVPASGGSIIYLSPQIKFNLPFKFNVSLQCNLPVYKNVNSEQLTNKYSLVANISKSFDFNSSDEEIPIEKPAVDENTKQISILVHGNCEMCKARIEKATNEIEYVSASDWSPETKILTVYYKDKSPDSDKIEKAIANTGHDTNKYTASTEAYNKLPKCCHYREK